MKDFTKKLGTETKAKLYSLFKKGKVTAREVQWNPETSNSLLRLGGFFSLGVDLQAFSGELVWFAPLLGEGKQSWEHFAHQLCGRSIRPCIFSLGCRNAVYNSL
jgi:hypothetical protein